MKTFFKRTSAPLLTMFCIGALLISSCKKDDDEVIINGDARIRVVNAVQGSNAQDFYQGDSKLTTSAVAYGESSAYLTLKAGNSSISFKNAESATNTATTNVGLANDASYTAFYYSNASGAGQITGFEDDTAAPASGKAKVRFVNLGSAFNNNVNVFIPGGTSFASGLQYGYTSVYSTIDANTDISVQVVGSATVGIIAGSNFQSEKIYTVWFDSATTTSASVHVIQQN